MGSPGNKRNLETATEQRFEEDIEYSGSKLVADFDELDFDIGSNRYLSMLSLQSLGLSKHSEYPSSIWKYPCRVRRGFERGKEGFWSIESAWKP